MAHNCIAVPAPPAVVFEYLLDPSTYPRWLIGAERIRDLDDDWPLPGSRFHHRVGVGPLKVNDYSEILALDAPRCLQLSVRATPLIRAVVTFSLRGDDEETILCLQEEPEARLVGNLVRPVLDPVTHLRNHRSLRQFARIVAEDLAGGHPGTTPPDASRLPG